MSASFSDLPLFSAWRASAPAKASALRALLADGKWHGQGDLISVAGLRYGARLHEAKNGIDGHPPLRFEKRIRGRDDRIVEYREVRDV